MFAYFCCNWIFRIIFTSKICVINLLQKADLNKKVGNYELKKKIKKIKTIYKNGKKILKFDDTDIEKYKFHHHKNPISIAIIDINKIVVFNTVSLGKKNVRFLPNMSACRRNFDETKYMSFFTKAEKLLETYNEIWKKVSNIIKKEFDSKLVYNEKYLKTKIKSHNGKINKNFQNNKIRKEGSQYICLSVIFIETVYRKDKKLLSSSVFRRM